MVLLTPEKGVNNGLATALAPTLYGQVNLKSQVAAIFRKLFYRFQTGLEATGPLLATIRAMSKSKGFPLQSRWRGTRRSN
jgi:hypothetical protein